MGKAKYAWLTFLPMLFVGVTTVTAGVEGIQTLFWPMHLIKGKVFAGYLDTALMSIFIAGVILVVVNATLSWFRVLTGGPVPQDAFGPPVTKEGEIKMGCC
jgi:carbon starvation protein